MSLSRFLLLPQSPPPPPPLPCPKSDIMSQKIVSTPGTKEKVKGGTLPGTKRLKKKAEDSLRRRLTDWGCQGSGATPQTQCQPPGSSPTPAEVAPDSSAAMGGGRGPSISRERRPPEIESGEKEEEVGDKNK